MKTREEMIWDGTICQVCEEPFEYKELPGYSRTCAICRKHGAGESMYEPTNEEIDEAVPVAHCPYCGKAWYWTGPGFCGGCGR